MFRVLETFTGHCFITLIFHRIFLYYENCLLMYFFFPLWYVISTENCLSNYFCSGCLGIGIDEYSAFYTLISAIGVVVLFTRNYPLKCQINLFGFVILNSTLTPMETNWPFSSCQFVIIRDADQQCGKNNPYWQFSEGLPHHCMSAASHISRTSMCNV